MLSFKFESSPNSSFVSLPASSYVIASDRRERGNLGGGMFLDLLRHLVPRNDKAWYSASTGLLKVIADPGFSYNISGLS